MALTIKHMMRNSGD